MGKCGCSVGEGNFGVGNKERRVGSWFAVVWFVVVVGGLMKVCGIGVRYSGEILYFYRVSG